MKKIIMNSKIKILIGILVIGIVLIFGWLILKNKSGEPIILPFVCSVEHPEFCNRNCNTDKDCYPSCNRDCGCIRSGEKCFGDVKCQVPPFSCKCFNNSCEIVEFDELRQATIATDKTEYEQGDMMEITFKNDLNYSIWFRPGCMYPFWGAERLVGTSWIEIFVGPIAACEKAPILIELKAGEKIMDIWDLREYIWDESGNKGQFAGNGTYRIVLEYSTSDKHFSGSVAAKIYSNEFTIKEKNQAKITKEQAIIIANTTEEVQEFLKLYPDATINVTEDECFCSFDPLVICEMCHHIYVITYGKEPSQVKIAIVPYSSIYGDAGHIFDRYPRLEYIKNATYCESDKDCVVLQECPRIYYERPCVTGCANIYHKAKIEKEAICIQCVACAPCPYECLYIDLSKYVKCVNNTCVIEK